MQDTNRSLTKSGAAAVATVAVATLARMSLTPVIGPTEYGFITFFAAVLFCAWYAGVLAGALSLVLSTLAAAYFFVPPTNSLLITDLGDQVALLVFFSLCIVMILLSHSQTRAVERAKLLNASLIESEARAARARDWLQTTLSSIGDAVIATDVQGRVTFLNRVAATLTGWPDEKAAGVPLNEIFVISNEETGAPVQNPVDKVLLAGKIVGLANHTRLTAKDGRHIPIDDSAAPIRDSQGNVIGVVLVFRDVSERKIAEEALNKSLQELRRVNEDLSQFAFAASHDFQEPLRMITSYSQLLVKDYGGPLEGEAAVCVGYITEGTRRMRELLTDLLAFTQLGADEPTDDSVELDRVVHGVTQSLKTAVEESNSVITSDPLPSVRGLEVHFVQLFQNLIGNAIKYRSERSPRIHISVEKQDDTWRFAVTDNGIGIAPEYQDKIFGVFKRLHGRNIPGTGIGLAICQRVVARYGGKIWVESELDKGAKFYFTLPRSVGEG